MSENELRDNLKLFAAIHFYQLNKLSIGKAAALSGLSIFEFEKILATYNIPISNLDINDIEDDIKKLSKI